MARRKDLLGPGKSLFLRGIGQFPGEKAFWAREKPFPLWNWSILLGKDFWGSGKVFPVVQLVRPSGEKTFWVRERSFPSWNWSIPVGKDLFLAPPPQFSAGKVFGIGRNPFDRLAGIKDGWKSSFLAPIAGNPGPGTLLRGRRLARFFVVLAGRTSLMGQSR